ncbi:MAG TPA: radical SAM protein [bacterium]|nr:radical SAM protein [bacterium]HQO33854.1 radical SAM protein [bacterium]HQP98851.1 radical SAM protein [bacterium]
MKILLVNPNLMKPPVTPVALDYLGQALEQAGFDVELLDLSFADDPVAAIEQSVTDNEDLVAVTVRNTDDCYLASRDFILDKTKVLLAEIRRRTSAPVIVGGAGYSIFPNEILEYLGADAGVMGEGERVLCEVALSVRDKRDWTEIPGLITRKTGFEKVYPGEPVDLRQMDLAARPVVDNVRYLKEGGMVGFETKRGCDQHCFYCPEPVSRGSCIRLRDPENVAQELANLLERGVDTFHTCDSEFNLPPEHAMEVCEAIIRKGIANRIRWYAYAAPHAFPEELAAAMRRAGCVGIDFGVDHTNGDILSRFGRHHRLEDLISVADRCRRHGFAVMYDLLLGGPGETRETIEECIRAMKSLPIDRFGISFGIRVYPGTGVARLVDKEGFHSGNPNLRGSVEGNESRLRPVYYVSHSLGENIDSFFHDLVKDDNRFLFGGTEQTGQNYNYNDNSVLAQAIRNGARGAFWDILRRLTN